MSLGSIRGLRFLDVPTVPVEVLGLGTLSFTGSLLSLLTVFTPCADSLRYPATGRGGEITVLWTRRDPGW